MFNSTFNSISVISWWLVSLVEETGENHRPVASYWQTFSHNVASNSPRHNRGSNSQFWRWWALIAQVVVNPTTIRSRPLRPLPPKVFYFYLNIDLKNPRPCRTGNNFMLYKVWQCLAVAKQLHVIKSLSVSGILDLWLSPCIYRFTLIIIMNVTKLFTEILLKVHINTLHYKQINATNNV